MKKTLFLLLAIGFVCILTSCSGNVVAAYNREREAQTAKLQSEYAIVVNKLEMKEGNFQTFRRVTFYNVRLGEIVFVCEGHSHIQIDNDGDVEIVVKVDNENYLRHYLGQKDDITYFSEQLKPTQNVDSQKYKIVWNPKLWIPEFDNEL